MEYSYAATNVQLQRSKGDKVLIIPNTFKEAMAFPETARWKAASIKETESLRTHKVYDLVPITSIPTGAESDQLVLGTRSRRTNHLRGAWSFRHGIN